ncbi:MAG: ATP-binding protein [Actinomycetota bacterium]|nr:ATP-binding protein [Actinomycetota bacterium]
MSVDPELLRALERSVVDDPDNRALRLHLVDLLLEDDQHAAALGHCEALLRVNRDDAGARERGAIARRGLGLDADAAPSPAAKREPAPAPGTPWAAPSTEDLAEIVRPEVTLDDVAGMDDVKQRLRLGFLEPLRNEELREVFGQSLRSSLLLWGPPGCGKTFLAKALAGELGLFFIHVGIADILDMWLGSSERNVRQVFDEARSMRPSVLFIDELDALGHRRSHLHSASVRTVVNQLLLELDGASTDNEGLLVLGATNQPWDVDPALLRPGRFDRQVVVLPPDEAARAAILGRHLTRSPVGDVDLEAIAHRTEGYSGADLARVCTRAVEFALHASVNAGATQPVSQDDLDRALADTPPSTDAWFRLAESYVQFADDGDRYADLAGYLARRRRRGRR